MRIAAICLAFLLVACVPRTVSPAGYGGPGLFVSTTGCTDITTPVTNQTVCLDTAKPALRIWNGTIWTYMHTSLACGATSSAIASGQFMPFQGSNVAGAGNEYQVQQPMPQAGVVLGLSCTTNDTTHTDTFTLRDNGVSQAMVCTSTSGSCVDSNSAHWVTYAVGDKLNTLAAIGSGVGAQVSCCYEVVNF